jgi:hypothetical protein
VVWEEWEMMMRISDFFSWLIDDGIGWLFAGIIVATLLLMAAACYAVSVHAARERAECESAGGHYVKTGQMVIFVQAGKVMVPSYVDTFGCVR